MPTIDGSACNEWASGQCGSTVCVSELRYATPGSSASAGSAMAPTAQVWGGGGGQTGTVRFLRRFRDTQCSYTMDYMIHSCPSVFTQEDRKPQPRSIQLIPNLVLKTMCSVS